MEIPDKSTFEKISFKRKPNDFEQQKGMVMKKALARNFESVKNQIGFCGIWCGSCVVGNGTLRAITKKYKEIIEAYGLKEWAPKDLDYLEFIKGLISIQKIRLCSAA